MRCDCNSHGSTRQRKFEWSASAVQTSYQALAASSSALAQIFTPGVPQQTIVRIRGLFSWKSDQESADEEQLGAVGIAMVQEPASSAGVGSVPIPGTDAAFDAWMWHSWFASSFRFASGVGFDPNEAHSMVIDSKAMRKVDGNERIVLVIQNQSGVGMEFFWQIRILSQLV